MSSKIWLKLNDVLEMEDTSPNQKIWCLTEDGTIDFLTTVSEICNVVKENGKDKVNADILYGLVSESKSEQEVK